MVSSTLPATGTGRPSDITPAPLDTPPPQRLLRPLGGDGFEPPPLGPATPMLRTLYGWIHSSERPARPLVLRGDTAATHGVVKRLVASVCPREVAFRHSCLDASAPDSERASRVEAMAAELADSGPTVLFLSWHNVRSYLLRNEEDKLLDALNKLAALPQVKVVSSWGERVDYDTRLVSGDIDVLHVSSLEWDVVAAGTARKLGKLVQATPHSVDVEQARRALGDVSPALFKRAFVDAAQLAADRRRLQPPPAPETGPFGLQDLEQAARLLRERTESVAPGGGKPRADYGVLGRPVVLPDLDLTRDLVGVPQRLHRFKRLLTDANALRPVVEEPKKIMILYGEPGGGKTTMVLALAREVRKSRPVVLFAPPSSSVFGKVLSESTDNLYRLVRQARAYARDHDVLVLLFLDEMDASLSARGDDGSSAGQECNRVVNAFLEVTEGLGDEGGDVAFIGATNRIDKLDTGVLSRAGMVVEVPMPDAAQRQAIFAIRLRRLEHRITPEDLQAIATAATGLSGRDIKNAVNEAGFLADEQRTARGWLAITAEDLREGVRLTRDKLALMGGTAVAPSSPSGLGAVPGALRSVWGRVCRAWFGPAQRQG